MNAVVAGHVCLDIIPELGAGADLAPGKLVEVGPATFSPGGAVANVGAALARLGVAVTLAGRVGDDPWGPALRDALERSAAGAVLAIDVAPGDGTSYSIVLNPPGRDRTFLHHPGCNDTVDAAGLALGRFVDADVLHFGYPPLMRTLCRDGGAALADAFAGLRRAGVAVSLDMAMPDAAGASGRVDWRRFLERVLPLVTLFAPSWEELCVMLEPGAPAPEPTPDALARAAERLLALGPAAVLLKLGERGLYLRTAGRERLAGGRLPFPPGWEERELLSANFRVEVRGTAGAGDATIAGLLAGLGAGLGIEEAATLASAVGACSVEGVDAASGVRPWEETRRRLAAPWERAAFAAPGWRRHEGTGVMLGPADPEGGRA